MRLIWTGVLFAWLNGTAHAADTAPSYPELLRDDVQHMVTSPVRWENREWKDFGWNSLAVVGTAVLVDAPLRDAMRRQSGNNRLMHYIEPFGAEYAAGVVGGFFLVGALGNDKAMAVAQDGLTASLIASGLITPAVKFVAGRSRPRDNAGTFHFNPFSNSNASFPSGHTTEAFALASVIADHYDEKETWWVKCSVYTVAGLVGVARSYHGAHFASDVLAGAMIGTWVGKSVVAHNQPLRSRKVVLLPETSPGLIGVRITGAF